MNLSEAQIQAIRENAKDEAACETILRALINSEEADRPQILVVDDDAHAASLMRFVLESEGSSIAVAQTAATALELIRHKRWNMIFLDVAMPNVSNDELFESIRASDLNRLTPVIFLTERLKPEDASAFPPERCLGKPLTAEKILAVTRQILKPKKMTI